MRRPLRAKIYIATFRNPPPPPPFPNPNNGSTSLVTMSTRRFTVCKSMVCTQNAVKAQTSLAPLSRFRGSRVTTAHAHQCCRFQSYAKTVPSRMKLTTKLTKREPTFLGSTTTDHVITGCDVWFNSVYDNIDPVRNLKSTCRFFDVTMSPLQGMNGWMLSHIKGIVQLWFHIWNQFFKIWK